MNLRKENKLKLPPDEWRLAERLRGIVAFTRQHIRSVLWILYISDGIVILVVLGLNSNWKMFNYASGLFLLMGSGILLLSWMWEVAIKYKAIRIENEQLRLERDKLTRDARDYPQRVKGLESQKQSLENQLKNENDTAELLRNQVGEKISLITALESEKKTLDLKIGLPRRDIVLSNQEVASGELHLYIKVPPPPKDDLKYLDQEDIRVVKHRGVIVDSVDDLVKWLKDSNIQWAFSNSSPGDIRIIKQQDIPSNHELFFIGDIHGDLQALRRIIEHMDAVDPQAILVFMGDLFDRGAKEMDTVCLFLSLVKYRPGKILWLVGNHDAALKYENNKFVSAVSPASYFDTLNAHPEWTEFGREFIRLIATLPVAAIFPDGLWVSHGAVPHSDVQSEITDLSALPALARTDCVNARLVDQMKKIPNRSSSTHDVGYENVIEFAKYIRDFTGIEIRQLLCAHQHAVTDGEGIAQYRKYFKNILCHGLYTSSESPIGAGKVSPCIAKYRPDKSPLIVAFE